MCPRCHRFYKKLVGNKYGMLLGCTRHKHYGNTLTWIIIKIPHNTSNELRE